MLNRATSAEEDTGKLKRTNSDPQLQRIMEEDTSEAEETDMCLSKNQKIAKMKYKLFPRHISNNNPTLQQRLKASIRNSAHDVDFFYCLEQYLDEVIKKMATE